MTWDYAIHRNVDVVGLGDDLNVELWAIIQEGQRWSHHDWTQQEPDSIAKIKVRVRGNDPEAASLYCGEADSLMIFPAGGERNRPLIAFAWVGLPPPVPLPEPDA